MKADGGWKKPQNNAFTDGNLQYVLHSLYPTIRGLTPCCTSIGVCGRSGITLGLTYSARIARGFRPSRGRAIPGRRGGRVDSAAVILANGAAGRQMRAESVPSPSESAPLHSEYVP